MFPLMSFISWKLFEIVKQQNIFAEIIFISFTMRRNYFKIYVAFVTSFPLQYVCNWKVREFSLY